MAKNAHQKRVKTLKYWTWNKQHPKEQRKCSYNAKKIIWNIVGLGKCPSLHANMGVFQNKFVKVLHYWKMANCKRERMYWWWAATSGFYHHFLCQRPSLQGRRAIGVENPKFLKFNKYQNQTIFLESAMERYTVKHFLQCMFFSSSILLKPSKSWCLKRK